MNKSVVVPITNVYAKGDYTAKVQIGSNKQTANLILDSGSSTLVVQREDYDPFEDATLTPTSFAQDIIYGLGGWYGPVIKTEVTIGTGLFHARLPDVHVAFTKKEQTGCFAKADGFLGLAYRELNKAYDLTDYLNDNGVAPAHTFPWYLEEEQQDDTVREFRTFLKEFPSTEIKPYFTQLEEQGVVGNQFGFFIHRSSIYETHEQKTTEELKKHPLNNGLFILGYPRLHTHLYEGDFLELKVQDDKYYNVKLLHMQVGDAEPVIPPKMKPSRKEHYITNAIIDSGCSMMVLPGDLFEALFRDLIAFNPDFESLLQPFRAFTGEEQGIDMDKVDLSQWPDLHFTFEGSDGQPVQTSMSPETYWQTHAPAPNQISFQFVNLTKWPNQSIMGLPFMNNYFTIFDRSMGEFGTVRLAQKKLCSHKLGEALHADIENLRTLFTEHQLHHDE